MLAADIDLPDEDLDNTEHETCMEPPNHSHKCCIMISQCFGELKEAICYSQSN